MNLDDKQKKTVAGWIAEGLTLSDIQKRLGTEFNLHVTYMDVRFLVDDLKLVPKDPPRMAEKTLSASALQPATDIQPKGTPLVGKENPAADAPRSPAPGGTGPVSVSVDTVTRPGAMVSGNVAFSDGQTAGWYLDQMGRLGLAPKQQGYRPSASDLQAFQQALESELAKLGY